jgi:hypothetical protein
LRVRRRLSSAAAWALIGAAVIVPALMCGVGGMLDAPVSGYGLSVKEGLQQAPLYAALVWWPVFQHLKDVLAASPLQFVAIMAATGTLVLGSIWLALRRGAALARLGLVWTIVGCLAPSFFHPVLWDRYMSLMLVGVALLVAGVAETLPARWTRLGLVVLALWIVLSVPQITLKIEHWRQAGQITATVLAETAARYPRPAPHASFFFIGLPDARNGCHVWSCCIASALRWQYGDPTLRARRDIDHGVLSAPASGDLILDFSARGWMPGR